MRHSVLATAAAILVAGLAGCDGGGAPQAPGNAAGASKMKIRNQPHERLMALSDENRRVGLVRAIRDTGNRCPRRVEPNPVYQGEYRGMAFWTARCDNNIQYAVFVAANEDVQVRRCEDMGRLGLPACRALPPAEPVRERPKAKGN